MATFEKKVSEIFHNETELIGHFKKLVPQIFRESEQAFAKRLNSLTEGEQTSELMRLYDIAYMDYFYDEIDNWFMPWVIEHFASRFTVAELEEMAAEADSFLDFYQVLEVFPGKGS